MPQSEMTIYSEEFIGDQFRLLERDGRNPVATGAYWNQGVCGIAVAIVFERWQGEVTHWKAYIGATVQRDPEPNGPAVALPRLTTEEATVHAAEYGVKLHEAEARAMLSQYADVLGPLAYWK